MHAQLGQFHPVLSTEHHDNSSAGYTWVPRCMETAISGRTWLAMKGYNRISFASPKRKAVGEPDEGEPHVRCARDMTSSWGVRVPCGG